MPHPSQNSQTGLAASLRIGSEDSGFSSSGSSSSQFAMRTLAAMGLRGRSSSVFDRSAAAVSTSPRKLPDSADFRATENAGFFEPARFVKPGNSKNNPAT